MDAHWINNLPDSSYEYLFGVRKTHFDTLRQHLTSSLYCSVNNHDPSWDLALYLVKLRHNLPNRLLSSVFTYPLAELNAKLNRVRDVLASEFANKYVGFHCIDRSNVASKYSRKDLNTVFMIAKNNLVLIEDGIPYLIPNDSGSCPPYISLEPVITFTTTGFIVNCVGPVILQEPSDEQPILVSLKNRSEWLEENDLIISNFLSRQALEPYEKNQTLTDVARYIPRADESQSCLSHHQLESIRNEIKNIRNLIRVVKNRIRGFKLTEKPNWQDRLSLHKDLTIVCAIVNLSSQTASNIPLSISDYDHMPNGNASRHWDFKFVNPCTLTELRAAHFNKISPNHVAFPPMSREDLRDHTLEVFQVRRSYGMVKSSSNESSSSSKTIRETAIWEPCPNNLIMRVLVEPDSFNPHCDIDTYFWYSIRQDQTDVGWLCTCEIGQFSIWCCHHVAIAMEDLGHRFHPHGKPSLVGNAA